MFPKSSGAMNQPHKPLRHEKSEDEDDRPNYEKMTPKIVMSEDRGSQDSLDSRWTLPRMKSYDAVVFDMLRVTPDDFASQITLLDEPVFKSIKPEELITCAWSSKDKHKLAPNIVAFTRRFNHVSFWVVREVLTAQTLKIRAEVLGHFVKIAKRLFELNNYHALMSVVSALQSAPVFRLMRTWNLLHKKERQTFEKLCELMSEDNNRERLREHMNTVKLPCIPYLGMYLQDLIYIDVAHPHSGGLESEQRSLQMNNIFRIIAEFQQSSYEHLSTLSHVQNYLKSVRYIEELQKFVEEDNYNLSLKIEPADTANDFNRSKDDLSALPGSPSCTSRPVPTTPSTPKFVPGHRKSRSLGTNFLCHSAPTESFSSLPSSVTSNGSRHLLDDSLLEDFTGSPLDCSINGQSRGSSEGSVSTISDDQDMLMRPIDSSSISSDDVVYSDLSDSSFSIQGCLKRKTMLKNGKKPSFSAWTRYWAGLWGTNLVFYAAKHLRGQERNDFKSSACKIVSIIDWVVVLTEDLQHCDVFQMTDPSKGNVYKFHGGSLMKAQQWFKHLNQASKANQGPKPPKNLMSFE
uniref:Ras-specific guanine nucleotide-releasing factor RalGPS1-like n=1 Tax=Saccoglossus kowalevskii TaxID=10224 RepID=A0ABM0MPW7_SACKO|nr:PREDICTED: ras-specific guanine nucleotide-releasing factor RalGPS1-like [Saccoglossus kowalevskii]